MTHLTDEPGVRVAIGGGVLFAAVAAMGALAVPTGYAVAALLVLCASTCLVLPLTHAALLACTGWALTDGFEINSFGQLVLDRPALLLLAGFGLALAASRPLRGIPR